MVTQISINKNASNLINDLSNILGYNQLEYMRFAKVIVQLGEIPYYVSPKNNYGDKNSVNISISNINCENNYLRNCIYSFYKKIMEKKEDPSYILNNIKPQKENIMPSIMKFDYESKNLVDIANKINPVWNTGNLIWFGLFYHFILGNELEPKNDVFTKNKKSINIPLLYWNSIKKEVKEENIYNSHFFKACIKTAVKLVIKPHITPKEEVVAKINPEIIDNDSDKITFKHNGTKRTFNIIRKCTN
jgi:hypothetical protein